MDQETRYAVNDLLDCVEILTDLVRELNPGATQQLSQIDFYLKRVDRRLCELAAVHQ